MKKQISLTVLAVLIGFSASAGMFSRLGDVFRSKHRADTLIVTGNYVKSRLLAELVQHRNKQPIMLVHRNQEGLLELYYMPLRPEAMPLSEDDVVEFTDLLNPKRVVIIGGTQFVPTEIRELFLDRYPTVVVSSDNWAINAETLSNIFDYGSLPDHFSKLLKQINLPSEERLGNDMDIPEPMQ